MYASKRSLPNDSYFFKDGKVVFAVHVDFGNKVFDPIKCNETIMWDYFYIAFLSITISVSSINCLALI